MGREKRAFIAPSASRHGAERRGNLRERDVTATSPERERAITSAESKLKSLPFC